MLEIIFRIFREVGKSALTIFLSPEEDVARGDEDREADDDFRRDWKNSIRQFSQFSAIVEIFLTRGLLVFLDLIDVFEGRALARVLFVLV